MNTTNYINDRCDKMWVVISPTTNYPPPYIEQCCLNKKHSGKHAYIHGDFVMELCDVE